MSKIFETLNRSGGDIADLIRPLVEEQGGPSQPGKQMPPAAEPAPPVAEPGLRPSRPVERAVSRAGESNLAWVRTLSLRVPAPSPLLPFDEGQFPASEQYRILRTKITHHHREPHAIVVSSPDSGDGKSVSAINMAAALSLKNEAQVLLLDADLRKSAVHLQLGLPDTPGLSEILQGRSTLEQALVHAREFPNLYVLTAGTPPPNPAELLDSTQWPALCAKLRTMFRFVVIDSPPVAAVADYDLIQATCDGVILIVRPDRTHRELLRKALQAMPKGKFLGVLLNCVPKLSFSRYYGVDHYYQYLSAGASAGRNDEKPPAGRATE